MEKKVAALCHSLWLECDSKHDFDSFRRSIVSFTGDLGTEAGFANVPNIPIQDLMGWSDHVSCTIDHDGASAIEVHCEDDRLFPGSLFFAGIMHTLGNITKDMVQVLSEFDRWYAAFKELSFLLSNRERSELVERCFFNEEPLRTKLVWVFSRLCPNLAEWRWMALMNVCEHLLPRLSALRLTWDIAEFKKFTDRRDIDFEQVTAAITDPWYWSYGTMLCRVQEVLDGTGS